MTPPKTAAKLRVAVARDVLKRIVPNPDLDVEVATYLETDRTGEPCRVCALGSMALSALLNRRLRRALNIGPEVNCERIEAPHDFKDFMGDTVEQIFSAEQLGLIETAFEKNMNGFWAGAKLDNDRDPGSVRHLKDRSSLSGASLDQYDALETAYEWGCEAEWEPRERLKEIMKNIVKNGEFKP